VTQASLVTNKKNNIDLVLQPVKDDTQVTEASVHELIENSEFKDLYVDNGNIKNAIAELNSVLKPLQTNKSGREISYQVLERRDATISITIDKDEMSATAEISTALGGKHLTAKAILNSAQEAGVSKGFTKEQLLKLAHQAAKEPAGSIITGEIAHGKIAIKGKNSKIKWLVQSAQDRILRPKDREDGSVDMRDLGDIICVKIGDPLAKKIMLTEGVKGFTVTGSPLEPLAGDDITLTAGEGTTISPKNDKVLISTLVGLPRIIDNGMEVDPVYRIKNVDISTGHIKFEGSVIIDGDICEGMKVTATGDITVGGFVESATLEASGDITIGSGIIGKKQDVEGQSLDNIKMSAYISAKGDIFAKYAQYAEISCHSLRIENQMMHSIIDVEETLWLGTEEKANGKLIAGYIKAGKSVHAGIVGATAGSSTIISFSKKVDLMKEQLEDIEFKLKVDSDKSTELQLAVNKLKKLPTDKVNPEMLSKLISTYKFHAHRVGEILNEKEAFEEQIQTYMASVYIEATEKLYHGVQMIVGDFQDRSRREYGPTKVNYKERKIHFNPIVNT
jgi:uncharacterized protein (DUF342 family)